jgi:hypothetical protein
MGFATRRSLVVMMLRTVSAARRAARELSGIWLWGALCFGSTMTPVAASDESLMPDQKKAIEAIARPGVQVLPFHSGGSRLDVVKIPGYTPLTAEDIELLPELPWTSTLRVLSAELVDEWLPYAHKIRGIRALEMGRGQPPAALLEAVRGRHPSLVARTIGSVSLSPERTGDIVRLDRLETLKLWPSAVTDSDLHQLGVLEHLHRLEIGWSQFTSDGFAAIARLSKLRFLHIHNNFDPTGPPGLPRLIPDWNSLKQLMHLDELRLTGGGLVPTDLLGIESLPSLRVLHVEVSHFDDEMLDALIQCPKLETLHLTCSRIVGRGLSGLREGKRLKSVTFKGDEPLAEEDLRFLVAHAPRGSRPLTIDTDLSFDALVRSLTNPVNRLSLRGRDRRSGEIAPYRVTLSAAGGRSLSAERILSDEDMTAIGRLKELQSLSIVRDPHTDDASAVRDGLHHLAGLPQLNSLTLDLGEPLDGRMLEFVGALPSLCQLTVKGVKLGSGELNGLASQKALRELNIERGEIDGAAFAVLGELDSPISLRLRDVTFYLPGLRYLADAAVASLRIDDCAIRDADLFDIGRCRRLDRLIILGASATDAGLAHLAELHQLRTLIITTSGPITRDGVLRLAALRRLGFLDLVSRNGRFECRALADELGWEFQGDCSCGCMNIQPPRLWRITADELADGRLCVDFEDSAQRRIGPGGLRLRGPVELDKLELSADEIPFTVSQIHLNDCQINQLILNGINPRRIAIWGDSRLGELIQRQP